MSKNNHFFGQPLYGQLSSFHPILILFNMVWME